MEKASTTNVADVIATQIRMRYDLSITGVEVKSPFAMQKWTDGICCEASILWDEGPHDWPVVAAFGGAGGFEFCQVIADRHGCGLVPFNSHILTVVRPAI